MSKNVDNSVRNLVVHDEFEDILSTARYQNGQEQIDRKLAIHQNTKTRREAVKSIIFFIGDGMNSVR